MHPNYRSKGIGSALMREFLHICRKKGVKYINLHAPAGAAGFYKQFRFRKGSLWRCIGNCLGVMRCDLYHNENIRSGDIGRVCFRDRGVLLLVPYAPYGNIEDFGSAALYQDGALQACAVHRRGHYLHKKDQGFWSQGMSTVEFSRYLRKAKAIVPVLGEKEWLLRTILVESITLQSQLEQPQLRTGEEYQQFPVSVEGL